MILFCRTCKRESFSKRCAACKEKTKLKYSGRLFHDRRPAAARDLLQSGVPQAVTMKMSGRKAASVLTRHDIADTDDAAVVMRSARE